MIVPTPIGSSYETLSLLVSSSLETLWVISIAFLPYVYASSLDHMLQTNNNRTKDAALCLSNAAALDQ